jgi:predicted enzyme related to lactoylglutathione lyase
VAGIGPKMMPDAPTTWNLYIGTDDAAALGDAVLAAGGSVLAPAFDVGAMGRMAVFSDAVGAIISGWQPAGTGSFSAGLHRIPAGRGEHPGRDGDDAEHPAEVPSYWMVYFNVADVDGGFRRALDAGATEVVAPADFPGGRFAIVNDPQGAMFGLLKTAG